MVRNPRDLADKEALCTARDRFSQTVSYQVHARAKANEYLPWQACAGRVSPGLTHGLLSGARQETCASGRRVALIADSGFGPKKKGPANKR